MCYFIREEHVLPKSFGSCLANPYPRPLSGETGFSLEHFWCVPLDGSELQASLSANLLDMEN